MNSAANETKRPATRDLAGWLILAWVIVWSAAYFHSAVLHRFPALLDWIPVAF